VSACAFPRRVASRRAWTCGYSMDAGADRSSASARSQRPVTVLGPTRLPDGSLVVREQTSGIGDAPETLPRLESEAERTPPWSLGTGDDRSDDAAIALACDVGLPDVRRLDGTSTETAERDETVEPQRHRGAHVLLDLGRRSQSPFDLQAETSQV